MSFVTYNGFEIKSLDFFQRQRCLRQGVAKNALDFGQFVGAASDEGEHTLTFQPITLPLGQVGQGLERRHAVSIHLTL